MVDTSPKFGFNFLSGEAQDETLHNENVRMIQAILQGVEDKDLSTPPGGPSDGDSYIVGSSPTGDWSGRANSIAIYDATAAAWNFVPGEDDAGTPITMGAAQDGLRVYVKDELAFYRWDGQSSPNAWKIIQDIDGLAVTDGNFIVGDGATWVAESGATARASMAAAGTGVANTFTAAQTIQSDSADATPAPDLNIYRNSASPAANDFIGRLRFSGENSVGGTVFGYGRIQGRIDDPTSGSEDGAIEISTTRAGTPATKLHIGAGIYTNNATGGDQGADTINASEVYDDGVLLTCYVIQAALQGNINLPQWDDLTLDREIKEEVDFEPVLNPQPVEVVVETLVTQPDGTRVIQRQRRMEQKPQTEQVEVLDEAGNPTGETREIPVLQRVVRREAKTDVLEHGPARRFAVNMDELDPAAYAAKWKAAGHLPSMPSPAEWTASGKKMPMGNLIQRLWETVEVQAIHIDNLRQRIETLESAP